MKKHKEHAKKPEIKDKKTQVKEPDKLKALTEENERLKEDYLRIAAEFENFRKRMQKEHEQFIQYSNEKILLELLPIIDNFDRAHDAAKEHKHGEVFSKGVEMILNQLHELLKNNGVEKVKTVGEKFDPHMHEAIAMGESGDHPEDTVTDEVSPGYKLGDRLLRAAKVKISKKKE